MHIVLYAHEAWLLPAGAVEPQMHHTTSLQGALGDLPRRVLASGPDLVLVRGFEQDDALTATLEKLCTALPGVAVALICSKPEPALLMRAMQAGVRKVIASDDNAVIAALIARVQARLQDPRTPPAQPGRCIGFMPAKGGDGSTSALANLAAEMAKNPSLRLLLIDMSLPFGDLEMFLTKEAGVHDLGGFIDEIDRLDGPLLEQMTHHLTPQLHLIHGPPSLERLLHVTPGYVERLIGITRNHYDYVLIDLGLDAISLNTLALLDQLVLVCSMSLPSVRRASQIIRLWANMDYPAAKLRLVVSQVSGHGPVALSDFEKTVGLQVSRVLPQETDGMQASLLEGQACITLKPRSEYAQAIAAWAADLTGQPTPGKSIWQRLGIK